MVWFSTVLENGRAGLRDFYVSIGGRIASYIEDLRAWDGLKSRIKKGSPELPTGAVPAAAERRYQEHLRRLAVEFPEVAFWAERMDHAATRERVQELEMGMQGLGQALERIASGGCRMTGEKLLLQATARPSGVPSRQAETCPKGLSSRRWRPDMSILCIVHLGLPCPPGSIKRLGGQGSRSGMIFKAFLFVT